MKRKILILGANGMLGHTIFFKLSNSSDLDVYGTIRNNQYLRWFQDKSKIFTSFYADDKKVLSFILKNIEPEYVINCIGINRQSESLKNPVLAMKVNSIFPHLVAEECEKVGSKFIHFSTDYVFNGKKGQYTEADTPNPEDTYGRTKLLGEISNRKSTLTIRCSILGHELETRNSVVEWFLSQKGKVTGHKNYNLSGITTLEMANILDHYVIPSSLSGLLNVSSDPISKYDLLKRLSLIYRKDINIEADEHFNCNSTLDSTLFNRLSGYLAPSWGTMLEDMYKDFKIRYKRK